MYALKVRINDQPPVVAGADDLGVLNAVVGGLGKLGPTTVRFLDDETQYFDVRVGGLTSRPKGSKDEHLTWLSGELKAGDIVTVEIIETQRADPVVTGEEAKRRESGEREYFEHCKKTYFEMRSKYESEA